MKLRAFGLLTLGVFGADAFSNTSPFFFFSTHDFHTNSRQIESADSIRDDIFNKLSSCPSDFYILVSQPGVHVLDYTSRKSAPRLREKVLKKIDSVKSSFAVSEVVGNIDIEGLTALLEIKCGAEAIGVDGASGSFPSFSSRRRPQVVTVEFPELPTDSKRTETLVDYDFSLDTIIDHLPGVNYTVIYTTTPRDSFLAETETLKTQDPLHVQFKRETDVPSPSHDSQALFEKYQFFTPGIFMGLMVVLLFFLIVYVGISGLASIKVSYAAFDKANGPAAAAKKQQ
ncbi:hypothetical protein LOZ52_005397 [Ophidiomyces ophidiicola]|nr:hypothetical protein LOZ49_004127 [Ophidiomyces ophidiicola]KAI2064204.1 hypothetical protein LOZ40_004819 [Ophidiomyces ophidiicola]KAI2127750.1 hypothetical protein LOZ31_002420 [Ophidiomyces ophidiicola]KAI2146529.1 hypothetical protein LOZ28_000804 [Ophidiomyces ophidiicola]KAI2147420.1 hypothetical protein LOZ27_002577 [Ophidiomyces ophidiicola]